MQLLAPDILEEARGLSPLLSGTGLGIGFLLWSFGGRTHRFWLAMSVTLTAGLLGLTLGKQYGMQPLVAGLLLAVSAGRWPCRWFASFSSRPAAWPPWG